MYVDEAYPFLHIEMGDLFYPYKTFSARCFLLHYLSIIDDATLLMLRNYTFQNPQAFVNPKTGGWDVSRHTIIDYLNNPINIFSPTDGETAAFFNKGFCQWRSPFFIKTPKEPGMT